MNDKIEYPGVYVEEGEPARPIEGVTTTESRPAWMKVARAGVVAIGAIGALRRIRRRRRRP